MCASVTAVRERALEPDERSTTITDTITDPYATSEVGVTIKVPESAKWAGDAPWLMFRGKDAATVRRNIIEAFGLEADDSLTLFDVAMNAEQIAVRQGKTQQSLGGTVIKATRTSTPESASAAAPAEEPKGPHPLLAQIEEKTDVASLQRLWAENKAAFDADADLMAAYKAKGKALSA